MDGWNADFIPPEIRDNIICLGDSDHHEREGYTVSLQTGNYENDLHAAQDGVFDTDDHGPCITGSVYTDINGERQDPNARLINTLRGIISENRYRPDDSSQAIGEAADEFRQRRGIIPTISYAVRGQSALMNNWEDPHYFTAAFPTLFPEGIGGHQDQRAVPVSLMAFAEWALSHHSRRQVAPIHCHEDLIIFAGSRATRPSCTFSTMYCNSEAHLLETHYL
jgi:hypothetical protein